ncbi:hypothetical protein G6F42_013675 [Rhizopus arrhizus]|nr:hypothetical protein G6F42_013675 [Rhizopus arrhizus]
MNNLTSDELKKLKNQFEIEERVVQILKSEADIDTYNSKFRKTRPGQFKEEERLKSSNARQEHWNQLATNIAKKWFGLDNINIINTNNDSIDNMNEQDGSSSDTTGGSSEIVQLANILKEVILAKTSKDDDLDFLERPKGYNGTRDPFIIESWIQTLEDFAQIKNYNDEKTTKLGITLLTGAAKVWYQNLRLLNSAPSGWVHFKAELRAFFKPDNSIAVARDRMRALRQTGSISQYVQEFMTTKLSIPRMTDEEAVDKFLAGLRDPNARIHIKDNIYMEEPVLNEAIRAAHNYEGNRIDATPSFSRGFSASGNDHQADDPMDLSVAERRELYNMMKSWNSSGGGGGYRGGFRGGFRGGANGIRGAFRSRGRGGQQQRGGNRGGRTRGGGRAGVQCHNCEGFGHYMRDCPSPPRDQLNYAEAGDMDNDFDGAYDDNKVIDSSAYLYCVLPTSKSYIEPLLIDDAVIQKDLDFVLTASRIDTKLPLYKALVNGHSCSVLIDSGASANYISPKLSAIVTQSRAVKGQAVETANGHQSAISSIATFSLQLGDYKDDMEAYVFDTKFDLILGNSWLRQVQPIPDWFRSSWSIQLPNGGFTLITPIQKEMKSKAMLNVHDEMLDSDADAAMVDAIGVDNGAASIGSARGMDIVDGATNLGSRGTVVGSGANAGEVDIDMRSEGIDDDEVDDCDFVITARQFERLLKKQQVEECFLVTPRQLQELLDLNNVDVVLSDQEKENETWCAEFSKAYPDVFKGSLDTLPPVRRTDGEMIELEPGTKPISRAPYRMSPLELKELKKQLDDLLSKGFIEPCVSEWGSPVLFVKKPNGSLRMVCDYRALNAKTVAQRVPLPRIDECLEQLHGVTFMSSIDLTSSFWQQRLTPSDSLKSAINTRYGGCI